MVTTKMLRGGQRLIPHCRATRHRGGLPPLKIPPWWTVQHTRRSLHYTASVLSNSASWHSAGKSSPLTVVPPMTDKVGQAVASSPPPVKMRIARANSAGRSFARVQQAAHLPGQYRQVLKFEGEHVYHYGHHTFTIFRESMAMGIIPGGCLFAYALALLPGCPPMSLAFQLAYLTALLLLSRWAAAGRRNRIVKDLTGRHAIVTGATSGIGQQTAMQLAGMGADITMISVETPQDAEAAVKRVRKCCKASSEQRIEYVKVDLSDFIAVREYCKKMRQQQQAIDIIVNAAGVLQQHRVATRFGDDVQLATNFLGPYLFTEGLLPLVEAVHGRVVYVSCSAHVGIKGSVVAKYLSGRGVWSPKSSASFDGLEQYGFTKLGNIFHAQQLAVRAYPDALKGSRATRLAGQIKYQSSASVPATASSSASAGTAAMSQEPRYTTCVCTPGGVMTNLYRSVQWSDTFHYLAPLYLLIMRTAWEGSQTVVNCCVRDEIRNGGYYMNTKYQPSGLSKTACDVAEREQVMAWAYSKMKSYMKWD